ncbi:uncharacterized protein BKA55DRAFT_570265, partial [Fusarium redolens]
MSLLNLRFRGVVLRCVQISWLLLEDCVTANKTHAQAHVGQQDQKLFHRALNTKSHIITTTIYKNTVLITLPPV